VKRAIIFLNKRGQPVRNRLAKLYCLRQRRLAGFILRARLSNEQTRTFQYKF